MEKLSFWKYFWNTIKEAKWLLLKYVIVGAYLIVSSIISNKLALNNLTYFNAMITLFYFGEMISFGYAEGFGIYINQNIKQLDKSKKYAKLGLYFTSILVFIACILLAIFPNFVLKTIFGFSFETELGFYYIMLIVIFISAIFNYCVHLLRKVGEFKIQMYVTLFQSALLILSMVSLVLFDYLLLTPIAIVYFVSYILCIIFCHIMLIKNKNYSINLFKFEKLKLKKKEWFTIVERSLTEVLWEIGYIFLSLFILRSDIIVYNQYCFYENSLDIINGLFFSFVSVVAIKICRNIGEEKKEEAKYHATNSIKATFVIWFIYSLISLAIFIPLKNGINPELQKTAFICLIFYLIASLFRFTEWNLGTYILGQSEHFAKTNCILETCFMFFWIVLFIISSFIPFNIYWIFGFIYLENIIKCIIEFRALNKDLWLQKCN